MKFPSVHGSNLSGKEYRLPQDFEGETNIVLIHYLREQQANGDTWGECLERPAKQYPGLCYYELPTLQKYNWIQQFFIDSGMRGGIPDPAVRARTITLYLDVTAFNAALNLPTIDDIYVLLVNRAVPAAIQFMDEHHWDYVRQYCHWLAQEARQRISELTELPPLSPDSTEWYMQMVTVPLPPCDTVQLKARLYDEFAIEVPIVTWQEKPFIRISIQAYNTSDDIDRLVNALS